MKFIYPSILEQNAKFGYTKLYAIGFGPPENKNI